MAGRTPHKTIRIPDQDWQVFSAMVERSTAPDRSAVIRAFVAWYTRKSGAKLPKRPPEHIIP